MVQLLYFDADDKLHEEHMSVDQLLGWFQPDELKRLVYGECARRVDCVSWFDSAISSTYVSAADNNRFLAKSEMINRQRPGIVLAFDVWQQDVEQSSAESGWIVMSSSDYDEFRNCVLHGPAPTIEKRPRQIAEACSSRYKRMQQLAAAREDNEVIAAKIDAHRAQMPLERRAGGQLVFNRRAARSADSNSLGVAAFAAGALLASAIDSDTNLNDDGVFGTDAIDDVFGGPLDDITDLDW